MSVEPDQVLDRVHGSNNAVVLDVLFDSLDFSVVIPPQDDDDFDFNFNFDACTITAINGLWCLSDGIDVFHWADPANPDEFVREFGCDDPALNLDTKKTACTSLTVNAQGDVYLAGKSKGKTHNLIRLFLDDGSCTSVELLEIDSEWCFDLVATGRPLLLDTTPVPAELADDLDARYCPTCVEPGRWTLGLEERTSAVLFSDTGIVVEVSNKRSWNLGRKEKLTGVTLVQSSDVSGSISVLATTTQGRILAVNIGASNGHDVFDFADEDYRSPPNAETPCNEDSSQNSIRASLESGIVYATDSAYCKVLALEPVFNSGILNLLEVAQRTEDLTIVDLIVSTVPDSLTHLSLAPGVAIDLSTCVGAAVCPLAQGLSGGAAAFLSGVQLVPGTPTGLTLLQVIGIPDCVVIPNVCIALLDDVSNEAELFSKGIILDPTGTDGITGIGNTRAAQLLNFARLLPSDVTDLFPAGLPDMWGQRWVRAKADRGGPLDNHYDLFFGITDATFTGTATLKLLIEELTGSQLGCPTVTPANNTSAADLRDNYDVIAKVSEDFISIDRDFITNPPHETMLINTGCGSTFGSIGRWSLIIINGEFPKETFFEGNVAGSVGNVDDAIFAKLILELFDDLVDAVDQLACHAVDGQASAPLSGQPCIDFAVAAADAEDKLVKCIDATKEPKTSQRNQNCQAAETHLASLQSDISMFALAGQDPANRIGEMNVRIDVIQNVYFNLFFPSIQDPEED